MRLWLSSAVSAFGSRITATAIPLTAAISLGASPAQMAVLVVAGQLPDVLFGLPAGSWIDRGRHRQFLVGSDAGRAVVLGVIPLAASLGMLSMPILLGVAFLSGVFSVFSSVASVAVLPSVVRTDQLVEANSKLSVTGSVVSLAGPGFAGALIQLVSAPKAILFDAVSNATSTLSLRRVGSAEVSARSDHSLIRDIKEGLRELVATPVLRALTISSTVFAIGLAMKCNRSHAVLDSIARFESSNDRNLFSIRRSRHAHWLGAGKTDFPLDRNWTGNYRGNARRGDRCDRNSTLRFGFQPGTVARCRAGAEWDRPCGVWNQSREPAPEKRATPVSGQDHRRKAIPDIQRCADRRGSWWMDRSVFRSHCGPRRSGDHVLRRNSRDVGISGSQGLIPAVLDHADRGRRRLPAAIFRVIASQDRNQR